MRETKEIILASASARRKELLELIGLQFKVDPADYKEEMNLKLSPHELARALSLKKAKSVAGKYNNAIIIAADTFVIIRGQLLGKPHTKEEARRMLVLLDGATHSVITGFTILDTDTGKKISRSVETKVTFKKLTEKEIDAYVKTKEPLDKAGAYAIQGLGSILVKRIEGDYFNVIGLPLCPLVECLAEFGVRVLE
ncbi:Maf family protein [Candidatus Methanoperedens nitratireducens]|uniref:dTTP/UTP pyrophosphatase n=1 Tax=Candidatus Methanoperedens nitratireducens TaxID=1392998 RepID=A0A284VND0_9EURY|nr:Maf family protein [Candidatus Methanoperedens nitroreducens]SNQ60774.1 Maf-like protein Mbar_A1652 [Candidatus Methanoperedens nitroreducens]